MGLTPAYRIEVNGKDITSKLRERLLALTVEDRAGISSDNVELMLDDAGENLAFPPLGAEISVSLGYLETGVADKGKYVIDEVECQGPPSVMVVRGKAADMNKGLKIPKTRTWQHSGIPPSPYRLQTLLSTIAAEHGLIPVLGKEFESTGYSVVHQSNESDLQLLTRLGRKLDAVAKPVNGYLIIAKRGQARSASGQAMPFDTFTKQDLLIWRCSAVQRERYAAVRARYQDTATAKEQTVMEGQGKPVFTIRALHKNKQEAWLSAKAQLAAFARGERLVELTLLGYPALAAEQGMILTGIRDGVDGEWVIEEVVHQLSGDGFVTQVYGVQKQGEIR
ncbi:contractile injection system protein, VgrG/Pvc8 family [Parasalinivibrio latis]|uniref:phage late control D family protein n=1 Tax=Parasalinivibrio latis TaxID=2952610 RepID=UPI0030DECEE0